MLRCVAEGIPISGQVPQLCLLVQSDVLREQLGVQKKQSGSRPPLPRQHPQHQGLHGGQHLPLHTEHLCHAHQVCNPLNKVCGIDSLTPNEWVSWTMNHFLSELRSMKAIYPIFQIISLGRVNPAGADERPAAALDDHLRMPGPGQESPCGHHPDHIISDKSVHITC